jgi:hypothetical protein
LYEKYLYIKGLTTVLFEIKKKLFIVIFNNTS